MTRAVSGESRFAGLVFDFNGVLLWDAALQERAWGELARELRGTPLSDDEVLHVVHGRTNAYILEYLTGGPLAAEDTRRLADLKERTYRRLCLEAGAAFQLSPGARPLLDALRERGIARAIATSSERDNVDFFVEHLELRRWFGEGEVVYDDGSFPGKPAPDIYLAAAARLGLAPGACVVIEDAVSGIEAARRAGMGLIVALGPAESHARLQALPGVERVVERLDAVPLELFT